MEQKGSEVSPHSSDISNADHKYPSPDKDDDRDFRKRDSDGRLASSRDSDKYVKLFVGFVPRNITEAEIRPVFEKYGNVLEVGLVKDKQTGHQRGCCFIRYEAVEEAERAIDNLDLKHTLPGSENPMTVKFADGEVERLGTREHKLYVCNIDERATERDVEEIFSRYGSIDYVTILKSTISYKGGSAFVKYATREMALAAIDSLNGSFVMEGCKNPLIVKFAETKKRKAESDPPHPSYGGRYNSSYSHGRSTSRGNTGNQRLATNRQPSERRSRGSGFDVLPNMGETMPRPRGQTNGASWRPGHVPFQRSNPVLNNAPFNGQAINSTHRQHQPQAYHNQLKQPHRSAHYQQHHNQQAQNSQMHHSEQPPPHGQIPQAQQRMPLPPNSHPKFPSYPPGPSQSQWKQQASTQYLNQSPRRSNYTLPLPPIQSQPKVVAPLPLSQPVSSQSIGNTGFQPQSQPQMVAPQPLNQQFQYPSVQNSARQVPSQNAHQQNYPNQPVPQSHPNQPNQNHVVHSTSHQLQPTVQHLSHPSFQQQANYSNTPQQWKSQAPQNLNSTQPNQAPPQLQYAFSQQMPHPHQNIPQQIIQPGMAPPNIQHQNQVNAVVPPPNVVTISAIPSHYNAPSETGKSTAAGVGAIHCSTTTDWTEHSAPDGVKYYYNRVSGISQWEKPEELVSLEEKQKQLTLQVSQAETQLQQQHVHPQFYNHSLPLQQTQLLQQTIPNPQAAFTPKPMHANTYPVVPVISAPQPTAITATTVSDSRAPSLNPVICDWSEHTSPEGMTYYYNRMTGASQWEKPAELSAFEQQQGQLGGKL